MTFTTAAEAFADIHSVWKVHINDHGPMTPDEFKTECLRWN
ncbi:hypothetical protein [Phyllobacterium ifriqiyense]